MEGVEIRIDFNIMAMLEVDQQIHPLVLIPAMKLTSR